MRAAKKRFKRERDRRTVIRPPPDAIDEKKAMMPKKSKKCPLPPAVVISDIQANGGTGGKTNSIKVWVFFLFPVLKFPVLDFLF